jgi:carbamoyl-phosphate synthase large subunit
MRVLIVLLDDFSGVSRLPGALARSGFEIAALCHPYTYLSQTRHLARRYRWPVMRHRPQVLAALAAAIDDFAPRLVVPGDQRSAALLQDLASGALVDESVTAPIVELLRLSLGDPAWYGERILKGSTCRAARALGLQVPEARESPTVEDALDFAAETGYPVVLKRDMGAAGDGVRICADAAAVRAHFAELAAAPRRRFGLMQLARKLRGSYLRDCHLAIENHVNAVRYVPGPVAMRAVVAWRGEVLAGISTLREIVHPAPLGPSTLVRFIDHPDMEATARGLIRRWHGSGFFSFDFIVGVEDRRAYLLECNPRPVPVSHIGDLAGGDLCTALAAKLAGGSAPAHVPARTERVALFPQEWRRDPTSHWLRDAYHDVPWDDPPLLRALCDRR